MKKKAAAATSAVARCTAFRRREKIFAPQRGQVTRSPSATLGALKSASQSGQASSLEEFEVVIRPDQRKASAYTKSGTWKRKEGSREGVRGSRGSDARDCWRAGRHRKPIV